MKFRQKLTKLMLAVILGISNFSTLVHAEESEEEPAAPETLTEEILPEESGDFDNAQVIEEAEQPYTEEQIGIQAETLNGEKLWSAAVYYVEESDRHYVKKTSDFNLKYQIEFHAGDANIPQYAISIRVPAKLMNDRLGNPVYADDIAIPEAKNPVYTEIDGQQCLTSIDYTPTNFFAFNYYKETVNENGEDVDYYVYFNYKQVDSGMNAVFEVLYKNLKLMELVDGTTWDLPVDINARIIYDDNTKVNVQTQDNPHLKGELDTSVNFTSIIKSRQTIPNKNYAPALYTRGQVDEFAEWQDPENYQMVMDKFDQYKYAVWSVSMKVQNANQGYYVDIDESSLPAGCYVIGLSSGYSGQPLVFTKIGENKYRLYDNYGLAEKQTVTIQNEYYPDGTVTAYQKEKNETYHNIRVVVAYSNSAFVTFPKVNGDVLTTTTITNTVTGIVTPVDGVDAPVSKTSSSSFDYKEYEYEYAGDSFDASKSEGGTYNGWSNVYAAYAKSGKDKNGLSFEYSSNATLYSTTHITDKKDGTVGEAIEGKFIRLTAVDDILYASGSAVEQKEPTPSQRSTSVNTLDLTRKGTITKTLLGGYKIEPADATYAELTKDDYYYDGVSVTIKDTGYNVMEDKCIEPTEDSTYINNGTHVYAIYAKNADGSKNNSETWEEVTYIADQHKNEYVYHFTAEQIAREPYRVMAVHESNAYNLSISLKVNVTLRGTSPVMNYFVCGGNAGNQASDNVVNPVVLENNAGYIAQVVRYADETDEHPSVSKLDYSQGTWEIIRNEQKNNGYPGYMYLGKPPVEADNTTEYVSRDTAELYEDLEITSGEKPVRYREWYGNSGPNTIGHAYLNASDPYAVTNKVGVAKNDAVRARINVRYNMVAYNGYQIYDKSVINYMIDGGTPFEAHDEVVFYDLLPLGVEFDPSQEIVAGIIPSGIDEKQMFNYPESWDTKNVIVTVDPKTDVITDYNGTGQTLVIFHLKYTGSDPTTYSVFRDINNSYRKMWMEGYGISYGTYYTWENAGIVEGSNEDNIFAFTTDTNESVTDIVGKDNTARKDGHETTVYNLERISNGEEAPDAVYGELIDENSPLMSDITGKEAVFGKGKVKDLFAKSAQAEIIKGVRADSDSYAEYTDEAEVAPGSGYTYEITVRSADSYLSNLIVFDQVENLLDTRLGTQSYLEYIRDERHKNLTEDDKWAGIENLDNINAWYGEFKGLNLESVKAFGIEPVVYYSTNRDAQAAASSSQFGSMIVTSASSKEEIDRAMEAGKWVLNSVYETYYNGDLSGVKAYAIDMSSPARVMLNGEGNALKDDQGQDITYILGPKESVTFRVKMTSPSEIQNTEEQLPEDKNSRRKNEGTITGAEWAYNNATYVAVQKYNDKAAADTPLQASNSTRVRQMASDEMIITKEIDHTDSLPESFEDQEFTFTVLQAMNASQDISKYRAYANKSYVLEEKNENGEYVKVGSVVRATDADGKFVLKEGQRAVFSVADQSSFRVLEDNNPFWQHSSKSADALGNIVYRVDSSDEVSSYTIEEIRNRDQEITVTHFDVMNKFRPVLYVGKTALNYGANDISGETFTFRLSIWDDETGEYKEPGRKIGYWKVSQSYPDETVPEKLSGREDLEIPEDGVFSIGANETYAIFAGDVGTKYKLEEIELDELENWVPVGTAVKTGEMKSIGNIEEIINRYKWRDLKITKNLTHQDSEDCDAEFTFIVQKVVEGEDKSVEKTPVSGNTYYILDENGNIQYEADGETPLEEKTGTLSRNGEFTIKAGETILIRNLEMNVTYEVSEVLADDGTAEVNGRESEYRPLEAVKEVKMPVYSAGKELEFTNDYLLRPVIINKTVVTDPEKPLHGDEVYTMKLIVNGEPFNDSGDITDSHGEFTIRAGETVTIPDVGRVNTPFEIYEKAETGHYKQIYPAGTPDDASGYTQVIPFEGTIGEDGGVGTVVNGDSGIMIIGKEYITDNSVPAKEYLSRILAKTVNEKVQLTLKISETDENGNETSYTYPKTTRNVQVLNQKAVDEADRISVVEWEAGMPIVLDPWMQVVITDLNDPAVTYTYELSERDTDANKVYISEEIGSANGTMLEIKAVQQKLTGDAQTEPVAIICNKISAYTPTSVLMKRMKAGSSDVMDGSQLTFIVERYYDGSWYPAQGIRYLVTDYDGTPGDELYEQALLIHDVDKESSTICLTASDGKINYYKRSLESGESCYPRIYFIDRIVYTGLDDTKTDWVNGDLRASELLVESDEDWGQWYRTTQTVTEEGGVVTGVSSIVDNTNRKVSYEIEKKILEGEEDDGRSYTFKLNQVLKLDPDSGQPLENMTGANVPYDVYDENDAYVETRATNGNGEVTITAGQKARLALADGTKWTVSETQDSVYKLVDGGLSENGSNVSKLGGNLALFGASMPKVPVYLNAVPNSYGVELQEDTPGSYRIANTFTVEVVYSDGSRTALTQKTDAANGYVRTDTTESDNLLYPIYFTYTENDVAVSTEVVLSGALWNYESQAGGYTFIASQDGFYKLEAWGASGSGTGRYAGGKGAYTSGIIELKKDDVLYVYVGGQGVSGAGGYNGGAIGFNGGGGGATDFRLVGGDWKNFDSLKTRIMVAAGGGGGNNYATGARGGAAGGLEGEGGKIRPSYDYDIWENYSVDNGASQTAGGNPSVGNGGSHKGEFGYGGSSGSYGGGGGGGWYGGGGGNNRPLNDIMGNGNNNSESAGGGGSSYISGYQGCKSIAAESTSANIISLDSSIHYSGRVFSNPVMKSGLETFLSPDGVSGTGNTGNGHARITYIGE